MKVESYDDPVLDTVPAKNVFMDRLLRPALEKIGGWGGETGRSPNREIVSFRVVRARGVFV